MNTIRIVLIAFVICTSSINGQQICPTGIASTHDCREERCPSNSICYRKDGSYFCCGALHLFCPTKMHALHSMEEEHLSYLWGPVKTTGKRELWYNVVLRSVKIACPIPYSFTYNEHEDIKVLPVDFDVNNKEKSKPKTCIKNSDCKKKNDEFCGAASHPTFPKSLDRSGKDGAPLKFCYKFQNFGSTIVQPVIIGDKVELITCLDDIDCLPLKDFETFCQKTDKPLNLIARKRSIHAVHAFCAHREKTLSVWWHSLVVSIVSTVVCLGLSITFYILHRKSVVYGIYNPSAPSELTEDVKVERAKNLAESEKEQRRKKETSKEKTASKEKRVSKKTTLSI